METVASDQTRKIVRGNLNRIRLITVAGPLLCNESQASVFCVYFRLANNGVSTHRL